MLEPVETVQPVAGAMGSAEANSEAGVPPLADVPPEKQYCLFRGGWQRFCMSVLEIEEVVEWPEITPVPLAPDFLLGIFNFRGAIVPVLDVAGDCGPRFDSAVKRVVIGFFRPASGHGVIRIGIAADQVIGTFTTVEEPAPQIGAAPHYSGLLSTEGNDAWVLSVKRVIETFPIPAI